MPGRPLQRVSVDLLKRIVVACARQCGPIDPQGIALELAAELDPHDAITLLEQMQGDGCVAGGETKSRFGNLKYGVCTQCKRAKIGSLGVEV